RFHKDPFRLVMVPAVARQAKARELAETSPFNRLRGSGPWGVAASGVAAAYAQDALLELGLADQVTFLKLGFTHPLPADLIQEFLSRVEKVLVVEELEPYLEEGIKAIAQEKGLGVPIRGKGGDLFSRLYEYYPDLVVLLGALAATPRLPFPRELLLDTIRSRTNPKFLDINLAAFQMGAEAARKRSNWTGKADLPEPTT
ncbi:MAG: hypothetical protein JRI59_11160, partial [Deltaproteobacteria bacterium]|nr:hypothetical protein [Deltaproteobacteria bacterium]